MRNSSAIRSQSAFEYMTTYGWAILILAIITALLFTFISVPKTIAGDICTFTQALYCSDISIANYNSTVLPSSSALVLTIEALNQKPSAISNVHFILSYTGNNITSGSCFPTFVLPGGRMICQATVPASASTGQLLSGSLYVSGYDCGTALKYLTTKSCKGAQQETISGSFTAHVAGALAPFAYVTDAGTNSIYVVSTSTYSVKSIITLPGTTTRPNAIVTSPFVGYVYVLSGSNVISINESSHTVSNTIGLSSAGTSMVINNYGTYLYVTQKSSNLFDVISTSNFTVVQQVSGGALAAPYGITLNQNNTMIYVTSLTSTTNMINQYWANNYTFIRSTTIVPLTAGMTGITSVPGSNLLFTENNQTGDFYIFNATILNSVGSPSGTSLGGSQDSRFIYASPNGATVIASIREPLAEVAFINTSTDTVSNTISLNGQQLGGYVVQTQFGSLVYTVGTISGIQGIFDVIELPQDKIVASVPLGGGTANPYGIVLANH